MKYYVKYNESGEIESLGSVCDTATLSPVVTEITQDEYETLLTSLPQPEEPEIVDDITMAIAILSGEVQE